jgi:hypothetical protein
MDVTSRERQFMQHLRAGGWVKASAAPAGAKLIERLLGKGWIERRGTGNDTYYRITDKGLAAKMAPVTIWSRPVDRTGAEGETPMKIRLLRASNIVKEIEFSATMPPLDIQRLAVDLMFEHFERNQTHLWPHEEDIRGSRHEIQVISDEGSLLKSFDIRDIVKDAGLKFLGRGVDVQSWRFPN